MKNFDIVKKIENWVEMVTVVMRKEEEENVKKK